MATKIILKNGSLFVNRVHVPAYVAETVNFLARKAPGLATLGGNVIAEYAVEKAPGLDMPEAEALFEATALALQGKHDVFEAGADVLNVLACGFRKPTR